MRILALDPGIRTFGWVILQDLVPIAQGGEHKYVGDDFDRLFKIACTMQALCSAWRIDAFAYEKFFSGGALAMRRAAANYQRGGLDTMLKLACGHLPICEIHPNSMKKYTSGKGNAKKDAMMAAIEQHMSDKQPGYFDRINRYQPQASEHIVEAYMIGEMAYYLYEGQFTRWLRETLSADKIEILRGIQQKQKPWRKPRLRKEIVLNGGSLIPTE